MIPPRLAHLKRFEVRSVSLYVTSPNRMTTNTLAHFCMPVNTSTAMGDQSYSERWLNGKRRAQNSRASRGFQRGERVIAFPRSPRPPPVTAHFPAPK